ncbi:MAG: TM1266 family iron-only hydrogenase system putative regulator [Bacillota bacterium]|jgi:putative iron-only hydrogenase system regulator
MDTRIALIGIIVEDISKTEQLQTLLHDYSKYIVGRLGIPYRDKNINIICIVIDATNDIISSLSGKIGMIKGVKSKTLYQR